MRKFTVPGLCKCTLLVIATLLLSLTRLHAQLDIQIGSGTNSNGAFNGGTPCPLQDYYEASRMQHLYKASELQAMGMTAGEIRAFRFIVTNVNGAGVMENVQFKLGATNANVLVAAQWESFKGTPSVTAPMDYQPVLGVNSFTLTTPFIWNGTDNILLEVCNGDPTSISNIIKTSTENPQIMLSTVFTGASHYFFGNDINTSTVCTATGNAGVQNTRPNIILNWAPSAVCDANFDPAAVTTKLPLATPLCGTISDTLSWTGTVTYGMTFQWQNSADGVTNWTDIAGANNRYYPFTRFGTSYYRVRVSCGATDKYSASAQVSSTSLVHATTYYIDNLGVDNPATNTYKSVKSVLPLLACGIDGPIIIDFKNNAGSKHSVDSIVLNWIPGSSATNTITFKGNGATLLSSGSSNQARAIFKLLDADYVTIDGFVIEVAADPTNGFGWGVQLRRNADFNTVKNCEFKLPMGVSYLSYINDSYVGIVVNGDPRALYTTAENTLCDNNTFTNNKISGGSIGISLQGNQVSGIMNNKVTNNTITNFGRIGILVGGSSNTLIEGNEMTRQDLVKSSDYVSNIPTIQGISAVTFNGGLKINKNSIHTVFNADVDAINEFQGIGFTNASGISSNNNIVSNNIIYDIKGNGPISGIYNAGSDAVSFYHNTISLDNPAAYTLKPTYGYYRAGTKAVADVYFKNNQVSILRGGGGLKYGAYLGTSIAGDSLNYNNYYIPTLPSNAIGFYNGASYTTLAAWRAATLNEANSLSVDPIYKNAAAGDFTPLSNSLNDKGTNVKITTDYTGTARNTTVPDIGAYEFSLAGCLTNFSPGVAYSTVGASTCLDKPVTLNLKNNDAGLGLTYKWQTAAAAGGPWTDLTGNQADPAYTFKMGPSGTYYYRAVLSCNGGTPVNTNTVTIVSGGSLASGTYTIDNTLTMSDPAARIFASFNDAVDYLSCGIAGPVVFNVKAGVYAEKIRINNIPGTSAVNTVTFKSIDNNPATAELKYNSTGGQEYNYVVQLDSARYINFKALTLTATNNTMGRVFDIANSASYDSIINCVINAPTPIKTSGAEDISPNTAAIYAANNFIGGQLYIKGNTINNGAKGIYLRGPSATLFTNKNVIDGNTFAGTYHHGIHAANASNIIISNNIIPMDRTYPTRNFGQYTNAFDQAPAGINMLNCDSASMVIGNQVTMSNIDSALNGIVICLQDGTTAGRTKVMNNKVLAVTGIKGVYAFQNQFGMYLSNNSNIDIVNNVVSISASNPGTSTANNATALNVEWCFNSKFYNNTLLNTSPAAGQFNMALKIQHGSGFNAGIKGDIELKNNIIASRPATGTGGSAVGISDANTYSAIRSDYNLFYSVGAQLFSSIGTTNYANLQLWRAAWTNDLNSIFIDPAFISTTDLRPDATNPNSWALQGRGVQLPGNDKDIEGKPRAVKLTDGVPDLGAYEFHPSVEPPYLTATPATPTIGTTQSFTFGTDTVARIKWISGSLPTAIKLKRYSGVLPAGLAPTEKSMYYYVSSEVTGGGSFTYDVQHTFYDPWLRNLPTESTVKLGRTDAAGTWAASANSTVDSINNVMTESNLSFADKFTGMTDGLAAARPAIVTTADSSNKGTRFWVPYAFDRAMYGNSQQLKIVVVTDNATQVTVKVNGTGYSKTYNVPANTAFATDEIPKTGLNDARLINEGLYKTGVSIESTEPIAAYIANNNLTGALLLPTGTYTTSYTALNYRQHSQQNNYGLSWVNVVADNDNTVVEITPSAPTDGGRAAGVPFRVTLQRGEVYQVLGALKKMWLGSEIGQAAQSYEGYELSGTTVVSVPNSDGKCLPIGVFSGSGATTVTCGDNNHTTAGDVYFFQQNLPEQAWGKYYVTAPLPTKNSNDEIYYQVYRVMVKDPATVVKRNGTVLTNKVNNWYEFSSNLPEYIEADKPVMVAQYNASPKSCINDTYASHGMSESITYLTPLGHGVKKARIFRKQASSLYSNYALVIIPDEGLSSLKFDGSATVDKVYAHPNKPGYSVVLKKWTAPAANVYVAALIESDTTFTVMAYNPGGLNNVYVINAAMEIPRIAIDDKGIKNVNNVTTPSNAYTCAKTPFKPSVMLPVTVKTITWKLSEATGTMTPATNITQTNPVPVNKVEIDFQEYYVYTLDQAISFNNAGNYSIPVSATYSYDANTCDKTVAGVVNVTVIDGPTVDYTKTYTGCIDGTASFAGTGSTSNGVALDRWNWSFGDNTTAATQNATKKYNAPGTFNVALQAIATDGCVGEVKKDVVVNALPTVTFVKDSLAICTGTNATLAISNPATNATYSWYDQPTGGTATATGVTYTNSYTAKKYFYVGAVLNGCSSVGRTKAVVSIKPDITAPTVAVNNVGINSVSFTWEGVANANSYEVSTDGGATWTTPSSGSTGLSHTINGLRSFQTVSLQVRSVGDCNTVKSNVASATTLSDQVYVPNTFTPNGDGLNDQLQVYVTGAKEVQLMVFNQWGQKVFETNTVSKGWDGSFNGKKQPSGVYLYTCKVVLANGVVIEKNGSVNLIR